MNVYAFAPPPLSHQGVIRCEGDNSNCPSEKNLQSCRSYITASHTIKKNIIKPYQMLLLICTVYIKIIFHRFTCAIYEYLR